MAATSRAMACTGRLALLVALLALPAATVARGLLSVPPLITSASANYPSVCNSGDGREQGSISGRANDTNGVTVQWTCIGANVVNAPPVYGLSSAQQDISPNFVPGNTLCTFTARDSSGLVSTQTVNVFIEDNIPPVWADTPTVLSFSRVCANNATGETFNIPRPECRDNCAGQRQSTCTRSDSRGCTSPFYHSFPDQPETTTIVFGGCNDTAGLSVPDIVVQVTVDPRDLDLPVITDVPTDVVEECNPFQFGDILTEITFAAPTCSDTCMERLGEPAPEVICTYVIDGIEFIANPEQTLLPYGDTVITCRCTDNAGNQAEPVSFIASIPDTQPPSIQSLRTTLNGQCTPSGNSGVNFLQAQIECNDSCGAVAECSYVDRGTGLVKRFNPISNPRQLIQPGTTLVTCVCVDKAGQSSLPLTITVNIPDRQAPIVRGAPAFLPRVGTCSDPAGIAVAYTPPTCGNDACDGLQGVLACNLTNPFFARPGAAPPVLGCTCTDRALNSALVAVPMRAVAGQCPALQVAFGPNLSCTGAGLRRRRRINVSVRRVGPALNTVDYPTNTMTIVGCWVRPSNSPNLDGTWRNFILNQQLGATGPAASLTTTVEFPSNGNWIATCQVASSIATTPIYFSSPIRQVQC